MFVYFNEQKGKVAVGYQAVETIFIKCNFVGTNSCDSNYQVGVGSYKTVRMSPQTILVTLRHLVNQVGGAQENIAFGDPMQCVIKEYYDMISQEFPNVVYIDRYGNKGRTKAIAVEQDDIFYSDRETILRTGGTNWTDPTESGPYVEKDVLYKVIEQADYMINIAALKAHHRAGVTLTAKNHFGSHTRETAIQFNLNKQADVQIHLYDINGRHIETLYPGTLDQGTHTAYWDASEFATGLYVIQLVAGDHMSVRKCMLMK